MNNSIKNSILYTSVSDHFSVYSVFSMPNHDTSYIHMTKRLYNNDDIKTFKGDLGKYNWNLEL